MRWRGMMPNSFDSTAWVRLMFWLVMARMSAPKVSGLRCGRVTMPMMSSLCDSYTANSVNVLRLFSTIFSILPWNSFSHTTTLAETPFKVWFKPVMQSSKACPPVTGTCTTNRTPFSASNSGTWFSLKYAISGTNVAAPLSTMPMPFSLISFSIRPSKKRESILLVSVKISTTVGLNALYLAKV